MVDSFITLWDTGCYLYTSLADNFDTDSNKDTNVSSFFYLYEMTHSGS